MLTDGRPIVIAGAGIGGLSAATGLAAKGIRTLVLERTAELGEIGAGMQIGPNAFHCFDRLGVGAEARSKAVFVESAVFVDACTGEEIVRIALGDAFRARFKNPYAVIHRGDLHSVFLSACRSNPLVQIRTASEVVDYVATGDGVEAILSSGERVAGRALIGADGLHSKVRARVRAGRGDASAPRVSGHSTYRSVIPIDRVEQELRFNEIAVWVGPKAHFVYFPMSGWKVFNLAVTSDNGATAAASGVAVSDEEVERSFAHLGDAAKRIIGQGNDWKKWVLCDRDPILEWSCGSVTLLGDAAHPTLQYMAQGACMAMEDAVCLSDEAARSLDDLPAAFERYRRHRVKRTTRIQLQSRFNGDHILHPSGAHAALRDSIMRSMRPDDYYDALQWLYGDIGLTGHAGESRVPA